MTHTDCIEWEGHIDKDGYGRLNNRTLAHRKAWEDANGPIPKGLVIDHLCRNRRCHNVNHLEVVTTKENVLRGVGPTAQNARKTHCYRGHPFTPENTAKTATGRGCIICRRAKWRAYRLRKIDEGSWNDNRTKKEKEITL